MEEGGEGDTEGEEGVQEKNPKVGLWNVAGVKDKGFWERIKEWDMVET